MNISQITSALSGVAPVAPEPFTSTGPGARALNTAADRKKVAGQFEAVLVRQLLSKTVGSMLGGGDNVAGTVYGDMMTDALSQQLTAGQGLGLGRFIEKQLTPRGTPADSDPGPRSGTAHPPHSTQAHP